MNKYASKENEKNTDKLINIVSSASQTGKSIIIISGFITKKGFQELENALQENIKKVTKIVIGVYTSSALEAFEYISNKFPKIKLFIYRFSELKNDTNNSIKFRPILHAKIIAAYNAKKIVWAYTGSANITDFALNDKNIESGIWLNKSNLLESIDFSLKKILNKKNLINYLEYNNQICFNPTKDPDIFEIENEIENQYYNFKRTYFIKVKSELNNRPIKKIGLFSNDLEGLKDKFNVLYSKVILEFDDCVLATTIITTPGGINEVFPQDDIDFYINRKINDFSENGFFIEDNYTPSLQNKFFIILDLVTSETESHFTSEDKKQLNRLFGKDVNSFDITNGLISSTDNNHFKNSIIVFSHKQEIKVNNKQNNDALFDIEKIELLPGEEITMSNLNSNDSLFNNPIRLNKIKF